MRRPDSLAQVAATGAGWKEFHRQLADFLDQFYLERRLEMLEEEPQRLEGRFPEGRIADAYLAATAVFLARELAAHPPPWARQEDRKLTTPWFASRGRAIRATLLAESPAPFRERNLFVSENALSRA